MFRVKWLLACVGFRTLSAAINCLAFVQISDVHCSLNSYINRSTARR